MRHLPVTKQVEAGSRMGPRLLDGRRDTKGLHKMKKGDILEGKVRNLRFPNVGIVETPEGEILVKNVLPGQTVECRVRKKRHGQAQGDLRAVTERASAEGDSPCPHLG